MIGDIGRLRHGFNPPPIDPNGAIRLLSERKRAIEESIAARRRFRDLLELGKLCGSLDEFSSRLARTTFSGCAGQGRPLDAYCGTFEDTSAGDAIDSMGC